MTREVNTDPGWLISASNELGVQEVSGSSHNERILEYHSYTDLEATDDETAWCSAFVNFCVAQGLGFENHFEWRDSGFPGTGKAHARSWLSWGVGLSVPAHGCVSVLWRESPDSWKGHVGFCVGRSGEHVYILGGNQGNSVSIKRYPASRVLSHRWPGVGENHVV